MTTMPDTPTQLTFRVEGMTCESCCQVIDGELRKVPGVRAVDVDLDEAIVRVSGEELAAQVLQDAIMHAGYGSRVA